MDYRNILNKLDLSRNFIKDEACKTISRLFSAPYVELAYIDLSNNKGITGEGMLKIINAIKQDKYV